VVRLLFMPGEPGEYTDPVDRVSAFKSTASPLMTPERARLDA